MKKLKLDDVTVKSFLTILEERDGLRARGGTDFLCSEINTCLVECGQPGDPPPI